MNLILVVGKFGIAALVMAIATATLSYSVATAQETLDRGHLLGTQREGPYDISLYGLPDPPNIAKFAFTVNVKSVAEQRLLSDVAVEIVAIDPDGVPEWLSPALSYPPVPTSYVGNAPRPPNRSFSRPGNWLLEVRVDGQEGRETARYTFNVIGSSRTGTTAAGWAFVIALGGVLVAVSFVTWRIRRAQKARLESRASGSSTS